MGKLAEIDAAITGVAATSLQIPFSVMHVDGLRSDMRIFRNALHNADLISQRQHREAIDPQQKTLRLVEEILASIQHLLVLPTSGNVVRFHSKNGRKDGRNDRS